MQQDVDKPETEASVEAAAEAPDGTGAATGQESDATAEIADLKDKLLRALADTENLRRRHTRELEEARRYAMTGFARDLLDVADNMRRAIAAVPANAREENELVANLLEGVELTERSLLTAFDKHKVARIDPARGDKFDHNRHQAMFEVPSADLPPGHVAEVMQTGWVLADRLLRPAMVGVSKAMPQTATATANDSVGDDAPGRGSTVDTRA
ncbi:MAG: nucleotide exchange factor GrpE [Geminicoccaceae bacterium]|mgnify:CR=1 FL=1|jgi:molecular chaperone GrpE|nr:nucleotide exchange factor GrpE [Geminicoccaceae bacterium]MCB9967647.1 nucleotide exchange factor GrpE [Geminicoccaceae bacterium]HRY27468.1 nucleotide exchange factor GrpE [Geminicoccaceae bacterium]